MDFCAQPDLISVEKALTLMREALTPLTEVHVVGLIDALDRVLSESIYSDINVPPNDNSAMDGYAFRYDDPQKPLDIIGESMAGHPFMGDIKTGQCVRITTGAVIPAGVDTVVMQEHVHQNGSLISFNTSPLPGTNIRRAGEDIQCGTLVLPRGHRVTPVDIGLLASLGCARVNVYRRLRVALLSTGDELTPLGLPLQPGQIYDSNRISLNALLQRLNVEVIDVGVTPDVPEIIKETFIKAAQMADAVISTGGVSVGDADYTKDVLSALGSIYFWKVAMKPGKPFAFGTINDKWFFGLPGNPVSAVVTYHQLVVPGLRYLSGELPTEKLYLSAVTRLKLDKKIGRADYQRGILINQDGINYVESTGPQGSGILTSMAHANCYIVLDKEQGNIQAGETVKIIIFDKFIN